jgi:hypothetical protein
VPAFLSHRVVLRSSLSYAERVRSVDLAGRPMERRVCFFLQQSIPELWMRDRIVLALDADEFLMRPPQLPDADALLASTRFFREVVIAVPYTTTPFKVLSIVIGVIGLSAVTRRA